MHATCATTMHRVFLRHPHPFLHKQRLQMQPSVMKFCNASHVWEWGPGVGGRRPSRSSQILHAAVETRPEGHSRVALHKARLLEVLEGAEQINRKVGITEEVEAALTSLYEAHGPVTAEDLGLLYTALLVYSMAGIDFHVDLSEAWVHGVFMNRSAYTSNAVGEGLTTCGAMTFGSLEPKDLQVRVLRVEAAQGQGAPDEYVVTTTFKVETGPLANVKGQYALRGQYTMSDEPDHTNRQYIEFQGMDIGPAPSDADKAAWLAAFLEFNPNMSKDGVIPVKFPQPLKGYRDFLYIDDELQVTIGNRGGTTVIQRVA